MLFKIQRKVLYIRCLSLIAVAFLSSANVSVVSSRLTSPSEKLKLRHNTRSTQFRREDISNGIQSKVVFPVPEDVVTNRSYLPDLGFLADLAFLFMPDFPASGLVRLSRDLFESEQCVQYVSCEMTKVSQRHNLLNWMQNFLQDFPFQGDLAERLRQGSMDAIEKTTKDGNGKARFIGNNQGGICTFTCNPIKSLTRGLKILSLLHDLVRTVK